MADRNEGQPPSDAASPMPELSQSEHEDAERRGAVRVDVIHEAIRKEGEDELSRSSSALAWSGLAAGLSMGFSLVAEGLICCPRCLATSWAV